MFKNQKSFTISSANGDFKNVQDAITYLNTNMSSDTALRVNAGTYPISNTVTINLPFSVNFIGDGYNIVVFAAASGLTNKPMFDLKSATAFHRLNFEATTLSNYGTLSTENCLNVTTDGNYHEIEDNLINGFYKGISNTSNSEIWHFDSVVSNCNNCGVELNTSSSDQIYRVVATDFFYNHTNFNLIKASGNSVATFETCHFRNNTGLTDINFNYSGSSYLFKSVVIKQNWWDLNGTYLQGMDFTRSDARDANIVINDNVGLESYDPHCKVNVVSNTGITNTSGTSIWTKVQLSATTFYTKKFKVENNKLTYQPNNTRDTISWVSGNLLAGSNTATNYELSIIKNRQTGTTNGVMSITTDANGRTFAFSFNSYVSDMVANDFLELYIRNVTNALTTTVSNLTWFVQSR